MKLILYIRCYREDSDSGSEEKNTGSGGPKINGSDRIRILIPASTLPPILLGLNLDLTRITSVADLYSGSHF